MSQVDAVQTPASAADVLGAIQAAGVSQNAAVMLAAQSAFETAGWTALWNYNLGNITTNGADFYLLGSDQTHRYLPYDSLQEGAAGFVGYLRGHGLIPFAEAGDLPGYVAKLKSFGYFESDAAPYQAGMQSWITKLGGITPTPPQTNQTLRTVGICLAILTAAGATAYYIQNGLPAPLKRALR